MSEELRAVDGNGFTPDQPREDVASDSRESHEDVASDSRESHEILLNPPADPALRAAWMQGYLAAVSIVVARGQAQLEEIARRAAA